MNKGEKRIVVNTSPWIALSICGQNHLLKILYDEIYIPVKVKEEIIISFTKRGLKKSLICNRSATGRQKLIR